MSWGYYDLDQDSCERNDRGDIIVARTGDWVTDLQTGDFYEWKDLQEITLANVDKIGHRAFLRCNALNKIKYTKNIEFIGQCAFCESGLNDYENRYFKILPKNLVDKKFSNIEFEINKQYNFGNDYKLDAECPYYAYSKPSDCFNFYYGYLEDLRFFEVELGEDAIKLYRPTPWIYFERVAVSSKLKIKREYTKDEFLSIIGFEKVEKDW